MIVSLKFRSYNNSVFRFIDDYFVVVAVVSGENIHKTVLETAEM